MLKFRSQSRTPKVHPASDGDYLAFVSYGCTERAWVFCLMLHALAMDQSYMLSLYLPAQLPTILPYLLLTKQAICISTNTPYNFIIGSIFLFIYLFCCVRLGNSMSSFMPLSVSPAYTSPDHPALHCQLLYLAFPASWLALRVNCLKSVSYIVSSLQSTELSLSVGGFGEAVKS